LSHNNITEVGAKYLKHYLQTNATLRVLFLHWNYLGAKGGKRIAKALVTNTVL
jgi:Ran GTPase-activating protein (RanGAP) involved in mRNA processing and transport